MKKHLSKGFTLIELLIYAGVVAVLIATFSLFIWQAVESGIKADALRETEQNATLAMDKITTAIKTASGITTPGSSGEQSDYLAIAAPNPVEFRLTNGQITIEEGSAAAVALTSSLVQAVQLRFTNINNSSIKIEMTINYNNPSGRPEYDASLKLESSASLRR